MYLANKFAAFAVLLYIWKHGDCATYVPSDGDEMDEIGQIFSPDEFKKLINWIKQSKVCLRNGEKPENACYALDDIYKGRPGQGSVLELARVTRWMKDPSKSIEMTKLWYRRLYNSLGLSLALNRKQGQETTRFLLAQYGAYQNQRYTYDHGLGDKESFTKAKINAPKQFGSNTEMDVAEAIKEIPKATKDVMEWMKDIIV